MRDGRRAIVLGIGSDIGSEIARRLCDDGWSVRGYRRSEPGASEPWDLLICCYGTLNPIGDFFSADINAWEVGVAANLFGPLRRVQQYYPHRRPGASVCLFSGAGNAGPAPTYSAYCVAKIALTKMVECMDAESPDCKFFVLGPGVVRTKIHDQTLRAGARAANRERVRDFLKSGDPGTSHDDIYACLMACVAAPKVAVGGRNIYVPADDWGRLVALAGDPHMFKLRRAGDGDLRRPGVAAPRRPSDKRYAALLRAFNDLQAAGQKIVDATDRNFDTRPWPSKYAAPYGAITEMRELLGKQRGLK